MATAAGAPDDVMSRGWDARVRANANPSYLQATAWARVKAPNGWTSRLVLADAVPDAGAPAARGRDGAAPLVGAQVLVRRVPLLPWTLGYAPRGPLVDGPWTPEAADAWTRRLRAGKDLDGIGLVRMDPEVEAGPDAEPLTAGLRSLGWRATRDVQPRKTRIIDLRVDEAALWSDLRKKWRQYVNRARTDGVAVREVDADAEPGAFERFDAIMRETSIRAGVPVRALSAYRDLWAAFRPSGEATLLFAEDASGTTLAVLMLIRCGSRVTEPYGGMTEAGAEVRANYLLKWEGIRWSREAGAEAYDLWGLPTPGIAHFKEGFGGREVTYIGAWDLPLDGIGDLALRSAEAARRRYLRLRNAGRRTPTMDASA
jgi:peptidoglycan pentaglycine glycine transferase (the first glycine)